MYRINGFFRTWWIENKKTAIFYDIMRNILLDDAEL